MYVAKGVHTHALGLVFSKIMICSMYLINFKGVCINCGIIMKGKVWGWSKDRVTGLRVI